MLSPTAGLTTPSWCNSRLEGVSQEPTDRVGRVLRSNLISGVGVEGAQQLLAGWRSDEGVEVPAWLEDIEALELEDLLSAVDDVWVPVDVVRSGEHEHEFPEGAERGGVIGGSYS